MFGDGTVTLRAQPDRTYRKANIMLEDMLSRAATFFVASADDEDVWALGHEYLYGLIGDNVLRKHQFSRTTFKSLLSNIAAGEITVSCVGIFLP